MDCKDFLKEVAFFKDFTGDELDAVCSFAKEKTLEKGEQLFAEGTRGDDFYIVKSGSIAIYKKVAGGRKRILTTLDSQKIFGELALFDNQNRSAMAEASEKTELEVFDIRKFKDIMKSRPALASKFQHHVILTLCSRLRDANEKLNQGVIWGFKTQS